MIVQTLDRKIWRKDLLFAYLQKCADNGVAATIDFKPEGSCAEALGLYRLLDEFCKRESYDKKNITIRTANMIEHHNEYVVVCDPRYWYEIGMIQQWLKKKYLNSGTSPSHHFANFTSRSNWFRLWVATILSSKYAQQTVQTYHYDPLKENYNVNGYVGIDDLFKYDCDIIPEAVEFLKTCPRTIDLEYLQNLDNTKGSVFQHQNSYYPIQHPSNLNLLQYYKNIFVDIVVEPNISGNCFLVTEKLWRPIVARRPFIVVSNINYLYNLQKLGFRTFHEFWDEWYDEYNGGDRIREIEKRLEIIASWNTNTLHQKLISMQEILDHNYNTFIKLSYQKIQETFL